MTLPGRKDGIASNTTLTGLVPYSKVFWLAFSVLR